jgi:hypothetical protein
MLASSPCICSGSHCTIQGTNPSYFLDGEQGELHTAETGTLQTIQQELTSTGLKTRI